jgi:hypothetical protein
LSRRGTKTRRRVLLVFLLVVGTTVAVLGTFAAVFVVDVEVDGEQQTSPTPPKGVQSFENLSRDHTEGPVDYGQTPPVGGPHYRVWQNCGFYAEPVREENAVHSQEHGAVWITYRPNLPQDQVDKLRDLASGQSYVLVSPYPELPAPVVASAWGKQLRLEGANDPRLEQFVRAYQQGPQSPEPGAPCSSAPMFAVLLLVFLVWVMAVAAVGALAFWATRRLSGARFDNG